MRRALSSSTRREGWSPYPPQKLKAEKYEIDSRDLDFAVELVMNQINEVKTYFERAKQVGQLFWIMGRMQNATSKQT